MARVAVGGFQHETNTFCKAKTDLKDFLEADAWPPLVRGEEIIEAMQDINLPAAGFIDEICALGHEVAPLVWCSAGPSGPVTRQAFESVWGMLAEGLGEPSSYDGVYLDLHGAMVAEHLEDGEGEILTRARSLCGTARPVVASLDLHANTTRTMVDKSSALVAYRTYPHVDMSETGRRAARIMDELLSGPRPMMRICYAQLPFLIPLPWQSTLMEPMSSIMRDLKRAEHDCRSLLTLSFTPGFPLSDVHDCGPAVFAYGSDHGEATRAVKTIESLVISKEAEFAGRLYSPEEAVQRAQTLVQTKRELVILADTQDNPGGGGTSDGTTILKVLVRNNVDAVLGIIYDPEVAAEAHARGAGAAFQGKLGGKSAVPGESPLSARFVVERLGDGHIIGTGPFYSGCRMELGQMALLRLGNTRVLVASKKQQAADRAMFRHLGVCPEEEKILVLKSSVHFRADFADVASAILVVEAPGYNTANPAKLHFRNLRRGVRLTPKGKPGPRGDRSEGETLDQ